MRTGIYGTDQEGDKAYVNLEVRLSHPRRLNTLLVRTRLQPAILR